MNRVLLTLSVILMFITLIGCDDVGSHTKQKAIVFVDQQAQSVVQAESKSVVQPEVVSRSTVVDDSPEISGTNYEWLSGIDSTCHPGYKQELKHYFENDNKISEDEYRILIDKCITHMHMENDKTAKKALREYISK